MRGRHDPARVRALTDRLVAIPSVSPGAAAQGACAAAIRAALPPALEAGEWHTADGGAVVWGLLSGRSPRTVLLLAHYDTVGVGEFAALGEDGESLAFQPEALLARLLTHEPAMLPPQVRTDLEQERRRPGTWRFGRGALDMKSGIAAGIAALEQLAERREALEGSVLWVACPDEETQSAGMLRAVEELGTFARRLELRAALSLDYGEGPCAYEGAAGKLLVGLWVLGLPTHVGDPFGGADAAQLAASLVTRLTTSEALVEYHQGARGVPAVTVRLRDLKPQYDAQTALEAVVELNVFAYRRPLSRTMEVLREEAGAALEDLGRRMARLASVSGRTPRPWGVPAGRVLTYPELMDRAGSSPDQDPIAPGSDPADPRAPTFARIRRLARQAGLAGPAVVLALLPPYYPPAAPRAGGLGERLCPLLERHGVGIEPFYPFITDASYLAWRADPLEELGSHLPALGREYRLPIEACRALDLEVVTIGPWGRDAHGLFERVYAPYAFEVLPRLVAEAAREIVGVETREETRRA